MKTTNTDNPLTELRDWLSESAARCTAMRWFGALFRVNVAADIVVDVAANEDAAAQDAYSGEQNDLLAKAEIDAALADIEARRFKAAIARLSKASRYVAVSAANDHAVAERLVAA